MAFAKNKYYIACPGSSATIAMAVYDGDPPVDHISWNN